VEKRRNFLTENRSNLLAKLTENVTNIYKILQVCGDGAMCRTQVFVFKISQAERENVKVD